ncbi:MAG TPA: hypothetical protein VHC22_29215 [Pirellulales bacterium]|nr:hypothetical protein [Pirellulales bacterium]
MPRRLAEIEAHMQLLLWLSPWLMVAATVSDVLAAFFGRNKGDWPAGVRVLWGARWSDIRDGELDFSFPTLARLARGALWATCLLFLLVATADIGWRFVVFAFPFLVALVWCLWASIRLRIVLIDADRGDILVGWGIGVPLVRRSYPLRDYNRVRIVGTRGVISRGSCRIVLEGEGRPLTLSISTGDVAAAYGLARHIGYISGLPVF